MNSLKGESSPENKVKELVERIGETLKEQPLGILSTAELLVVVLKTKNIHSIILKRQRGYLANTPNKNDSYILGVRVGNETVAIKIHPDIFRCCREIYENENMLTALRADKDIPNIIQTMSVDGFRIVFYIWEESKTLTDQLIPGNGVNIVKMKDALRARISSIGLKGIILTCIEPDDITFCPSREQATVIDVNKLWYRNKGLPDSQKDGQIIGQSWLRKLLEIGK